MDSVGEYAPAQLLIAATGAVATYGTGVLEYRSQAETRVMRLHRVQYAVTWHQIARALGGFWLAGNRSSLREMRRWGFG